MHMAIQDARPTIPGLLDQIREEFLEMPGLRLTCSQACRLWGLPDARCGGMLDALVDVGFLRRTPDGAYVRAF
jgi:hypothetical protein